MFNIHFVNKGQLLCVYLIKFTKSLIPNHSSPILTHIQSLKKIGHKLLNIVHRNKFSTQISTLKQILKKIDQKMLKIEKGFENQAAGQGK